MSTENKQKLLEAKIQQLQDMRTVFLQTADTHLINEMISLKLEIADLTIDLYAQENK